MKKKITVVIIIFIVLILPIIIFKGIYDFMFEEKYGHACSQSHSICALWYSFMDNNQDNNDDFDDDVYILSSEEKYTDKEAVNVAFNQYLEEQKHLFDGKKYKYILFIENGEPAGAIYSEDTFFLITGRSLKIHLKSKDYPNGVEHGDVIKPSECNFNHQAKLLYEEFKEKHKD